MKKKKKKKPRKKDAQVGSYIFPLRLTFNGTDGRADDLIHRAAQYRLSLSLSADAAAAAARTLGAMHAHTKQQLAQP